jgi:hypothetical protein
MSRSKVTHVVRPLGQTDITVTVHLEGYTTGDEVQVEVFVTQDTGAVAFGSRTVMIDTEPEMDVPVRATPMNDLARALTLAAPLLTISRAIEVWRSVLDPRQPPEGTTGVEGPAMWVEPGYEDGGP